MSLAQSNTVVPLYCREQIVIPELFPDILKNFSKFIIKNQPENIITASAEYFANLARQQALVHQVHLSNPMSREQLETLHLKFMDQSPKLNQDTIMSIAEQSLLNPNTVHEIYQIGTWSDTDLVSWIDFWSLCCSVAAGTLQATLLLIVDILTSNGSLPSHTISQAVQCLTKLEGSISVDRATLCSTELTMNGDSVSESKAIESIKKMCKAL